MGGGGGSLGYFSTAYVREESEVVGFYALLSDGRAFAQFSLGRRRRKGRGEEVLERSKYLQEVVRRVSCSVPLLL